MKPTPSDQVYRARRRGMGPFYRCAEQQPERGLDRAELHRRKERKVDLQRVCEEENAVNGLAKVDVDMVQSAVIAVHRAGPITERFVQTGWIGDSKCQVEGGPAV